MCSPKRNDAKNKNKKRSIKKKITTAELENKEEVGEQNNKNLLQRNYKIRKKKEEPSHCTKEKEFRKRNQLCNKNEKKVLALFSAAKGNIISGNLRKINMRKKKKKKQKKKYHENHLFLSFFFHFSIQYVICRVQTRIPVSG